MSLNRTPIEWVKNPDGTQGYTWNPITGCLNHTNGLCKGGGFPCYAYKLANGRLRTRYLRADLLPQDKGILADSYPTRDPFYPRFWEDRLREQFGAYTAGAEPKGIFVCDMGDLFGIGVPKHWTERVLDKISRSWYREHRFYLLTKQPQNLIRWSPFPDNCWVGVTATDTFKIGEAIAWLQKVEAKIKFLSTEPLLDRILYLDPHLLEGLHWWIVGSQTKPYKPPDIHSVEVIVRACDKAGVAVFLKDNLARAIPFFKEPFKQETMGADGIKVVGLRQELPRLKEGDNDRWES